MSMESRVHTLTVVAADFDDDEPTGSYDVGFFRAEQPAVPADTTVRTSLEHLKDARVGLGLFLEEADMALRRGDLTVDQRIHVATIVSYIEGLNTRLGRVMLLDGSPKKPSR